MTNALVKTDQFNPLEKWLTDPSKDTKSRMSRFIDWLADTGTSWARVDLKDYRDYLSGQCKLKPTSTAAHLATVRAAYRDIVRDNKIRDWFLQSTLNSTDKKLSPADRLAMVNEAISRLVNLTYASNAPVKVRTVQDRSDSEQTRLTSDQARGLIAIPGTDTLKGVRDTAIIALMLCTGIREAELCGLVVDDLRQSYEGELALLVREGKGIKQRLIPYGDLAWCLVYVDRWLREAGITDGPVFRGFTNKSLTVKETAMSTRAIQYMMQSYQVVIGDQTRAVKPHDLRRSYARLQHGQDMPLVAIQQNLGHKKMDTTLHYIGALDAKQRRGRAAIDGPDTPNVK